MTITQLIVSPNIYIQDFGSQLVYTVFVHRQARKFYELFANLAARQVPEIAISDRLSTIVRLRSHGGIGKASTAVVDGPRAISASIHEWSIKGVVNCLRALSTTGDLLTDHIDLDCELEGWSSGLYITLNFEEHAYRG